MTVQNASRAISRVGLLAGDHSAMAEKPHWPARRSKSNRRSDRRTMPRTIQATSSVSTSTSTSASRPGRKSATLPANPFRRLVQNLIRLRST